MVPARKAGDHTLKIDDTLLLWQRLTGCGIKLQLHCEKITEERSDVLTNAPILVKDQVKVDHTPLREKIWKPRPLRTNTILVEESRTKGFLPVLEHPS